MVNFYKSTLCISKGAYRKLYNSLIDVLSVRKMVEDVRYLGNPLSFKKRKSVTFESLVKSLVDEGTSSFTSW